MERRVLRRRRPALSCAMCRRRKIKCDRTNPCGQCVSINSLCSFRPFENQPEAARTPKSASHETTEHAAQGIPEAEATVTPLGTSPAKRQEHQQHSAEVHIGQNPIPAQTHNFADGLSETGRHILARQSGLGDADVVLNKTRILRWSNWVGAAKEFQLIGACFAEALNEGNSSSFQTEAIKELTNEMGTLISQCKSASRTLKAGRPARCLLSPLELPLSPNRDMAEKMGRLYFESFESCFRIIHAPSFWKEFESLYEDPHSLKIDQRLKVLVVIGLGSSLCSAEERHGEGLEETIHHWIYAAETWLSGPLEKDRLSIGGIQLQALVILARQVFSIGGDLVWTSMGSLIHRAMQMGLHRDPKYLPPMSGLEAELRRRLWATIMELAIQASLDSALPPRLSLEEFDTEAPANINDEDLLESSSTAGLSQQGFTSTSIQIVLLESIPIRLRTIKSLNSLRSALSYSETITLSEEIMSVSRAHTKFIKEHADAAITPFHRNLLDYLVRRLLIPLHCSFANEARTNPVFYYSLKMNLEAAVAIISPEPDEKYTQLMLIGGGMFREGIRYANTVIGLEVIAQAEAQSLNGTSRGENSEHITWLKKLVRNMIDLAARRIAHGETNVKSHMFMNMILAQVSCIERGVPCEHEVAKGARDSLRQCYETIKERVGSTAFPSPNAGMLNVDNWNDHWAGFDLGLFLHDTESF